MLNKQPTQAMGYEDDRLLRLVLVTLLSLSFPCVGPSYLIFHLQLSETDSIYFIYDECCNAAGKTGKSFGQNICLIL